MRHCVVLIFATFLTLSSTHSYKNARQRTVHRWKRTAKIEQTTLPNNIVPISYELKIRPIFHSEKNSEEFTAPGQVAILVECLETTKKIILHKHPTIQIDENTIKITDNNNTEIGVISVDYEETNNLTLILLSKNLVASEEYEVFMKFTTIISNSQEGLYWGEYENPAGVKRRFVMTDLEPFGARRVFPCFDEPRFKTTFRVSIARKLQNKYISLSNADLERQGVADPELPKGWVWDHFKRTVRMSTYLVAVIVADFSFKEAPQNLFAKPVRVYAPDYLVKGRRVDFASVTTAKIMEFYEKLLGHSYDMPKLDSVAIPNNLENGAMENWGLVTFSEEYLTYYSRQTLEEDRQLMIEFMAHELSHQWFGNLVTCKWWSGLWLNEGFATYFASVGVSTLFPEFDQRREFLWDSVQKAMAYDVNTTDPVDRQNDLLSMSPETIIYEKGGALIRMIEGFLGRETLLRGLAAYIKQFAYQSVTQDDLFQTLTIQALKDGKFTNNFSVNEIMNTWTVQPGYPLIRVTKHSKYSVKIAQENFGNYVGNVKHTLLQYASSGNWIVPISLVTQNYANFSDHSPKIWLTSERISIIHSHDTSTWIMLNPDAMGFYRVLYDDDLTQLILAQLKTNRKIISGLSRSQLIDDYFNLAKLGYIPITKALEMTTFLKGENDFVVWYTTFTCLQKVKTLFRNEDITYFRSYMSPLVESALDSISWEPKWNEKGTSVIFRSKLIKWASDLESFECILKARELLYKWAANPNKNPVPLEHKPAMYCTIVAHGGAAAFDHMWSLYTNTSKSSYEKTLLMNGLACSRTASTLNRLMDYTLDPECELGQNTKDFLSRVATNPSGRSLVFQFIRSKFSQLKGHTKGVDAFAQTLRSLSKYFTKESEKHEVENFLHEKRTELMDESIQKIINSSLATINENIQWIRQYYNEMNEWFKSRTF